MEENEMMDKISRMPGFRQDDQTTRYKIDSEDTINEISHLLNGDTWNNSEEKWDINKDKSRRLCNALGNKTLTTYLRAFLNKNLVLTNLDHEIILKIAMEAADKIADLIYTSYDIFEIKKENAAIIHSMIDNNCFATLRRSKDGFFTDHLSTTQRYIEQSNISTQEKSKKPSLSIFGWGSNKDD